MANTMKGKSNRKPLTDISNASRSSKPLNKKTSDDSHDLLLLKLSHLSNLIHQIDDFVINACKLKLMSKLGSHEIESFTHVLSDIESRLQPWFPRFQQLLSNQATRSSNCLTQVLLTETVSDTKDEGEEVVAHSINESDLSPLVSPSPLVSWRAGCKIESERQLFLLTPLPRSKVLSSKRLGSSRLPLKDPGNNLGMQKSLNVPKASQYPLSERVLGKELNKSPEPSALETETRLECQIFSPEKFCSNQKGRVSTTYLMTPCLKMSPPKTCMLLEPISEIRRKENIKIPEPTALTARFLQFDESQIPESSSSPVSGTVTSKYPQIFGLQMLNKSVMRRQVDESLHWFLSPPKTCSIMETPIGKLSTKPTIDDLSGSKCILGEQEKERCFSVRQKEQLTGRLQAIEEGCSDHGADLLGRTPMWRDSTNAVHQGKRPGECTLKRELWAKFEAASANMVPFNSSILEEEATGKGFLDRLEEVSREEMGS